jgi:hypothetical protein
MRKFNHTEIILKAISFTLIAFSLIGTASLIVHLLTGAEANFGIYK